MCNNHRFRVRFDKKENLSPKKALVSKVTSDDKDIMDIKIQRYNNMTY